MNQRDQRLREVGFAIARYRNALTAVNGVEVANKYEITYKNGWFHIKSPDGSCLSPIRMMQLVEWTANLFQRAKEMRSDT